MSLSERAYLNFPDMSISNMSIFLPNSTLSEFFSDMSISVSEIFYYYFRYPRPYVFPPILPEPQLN
jgi:hypothetical protein